VIVVANAQATTSDTGADGIQDNQRSLDRKIQHRKEVTMPRTGVMVALVLALGMGVGWFGH
jgi:hypothetical protein